MFPYDVLIMAERDPIIEEIKNLIDLHDLIIETCDLKEASKDEWRGGHENKHHSESGNCLAVMRDVWFCHHAGCNEGGDCYNWIASRDGLDIVKDFPEILRIAAEYAGVELSEVNPEAEVERRGVFEVLKAAEVHYHDNLTPDMRQDITERWGITDKTIDTLLIGIARNDDGLEEYLLKCGFTHDQMAKSGLFFDWDEKLHPHFLGRYVFPYWRAGSVQYMAARSTIHTPDNKYEKRKGEFIKYKKLLTPNEKHPWVSDHVQNIIAGADSLRGGGDYCVITEGITDHIMAIQSGIPCISPVTTKLKKADHKSILKLVRRFNNVHICNDSEVNEAGLEGAIQTAEFLESNGVSVRLITLPRDESVAKVDLAEFLRDHSVDEFMALFDTAMSVWNAKLSKQPVTDDAVENVKNAKTFISEELPRMDAAERVAFVESAVKQHFGLSDDVVSELVRITHESVGDIPVTDRLIELGKQDTVLFHTPDDTCFAAIKLGTGGYAIYPLNEKSKQLKKILRQRYYKTTGKAPQADALKAAIGVLEGIAAFDGDEIELHNRVAWHNGSIVYDLTNSNFEAIEIRSDGGGIMPHGHILFRRFGHQTAQVNPVHGGDVWRLFEFVNVPESDRLLVMVYLISCLVPGIAHVIPIIIGEQGAAKTTSSRLFKLLIDPSALDVISLPRNEDRMHQLLSHHWFVIFDNISHIQRWQSDAICRASTGQATNVRTLYTDDDDTIFKYKMCMGLNGINNAATNSDLLDRAFFLNLDPIPTDQRIEEKPLLERFNAAKPEILGGMFDALSKALKIYPTIELKEKPRMADFAVWGCAIAEALGYPRKEFLDAYYTNIGQINHEALAESVIGNIMLSFMEQRAEWESTPTELHNELEMLASAHGIDPKNKAWVKTPRSLGKRLG